jgi:hypothetical protein
VSLREPATLSVLCVKMVILRPAANALVPVKEVNEPPFGLPETLEVGMLCPTPSVNAAVVLLVNAYSVIVSGGTDISHCVVMVICEVPEPTPFRGSVKLTVEGAAETVRVWPCEPLQKGPARHKTASAAFRRNPFTHRPDTTIPYQELRFVLSGNFVGL